MPRAEPGQEEEWGKLQAGLGFLVGFFVSFFWSMLEGDQWREKQEKPEDRGAAVPCCVKVGAWSMLEPPK